MFGELDILVDMPLDLINLEELDSCSLGGLLLLGVHQTDCPAKVLK